MLFSPRPHVVPKTSSGKLQRAACKKMYLDGQLGKRQMPAWVQVAKLAASSLLRKAWGILITMGKFFYTLYMVLLILITFFPMFFLVKHTSRDFAVKACRIWAKWLLTIGILSCQSDGQEKLNTDYARHFCV